MVSRRSMWLCVNVRLLIHLSLKETNSLAGLMLLYSPTKTDHAHVLPLSPLSFIIVYITALAPLGVAIICIMQAGELAPGPAEVDPCDRPPPF
jgi:hypothetical protein